MGGLRKLLKAAMVMPDGPDSASSAFLPDSVLRKLINESNVAEVLAEHQAELRNGAAKLTSYICARGGAMKIFATLVWDENEDLIDKFFNNGITDAMLPLHESASIFSKGWKDSKIEHFCGTQWRFLAPVFHERQFDYFFDGRCRIPLIPNSENRKARRYSHFSIVDKWLIHEHHIQISPNTFISRDPDGHPLVAIKLLKNGIDQAAQTEAEVLTRLRSLNHPHLIKAIAHYTKGDDHYFMFPWADGGNLRDFWKGEPPRKLDGEFIRWAFDQFQGLAGAIERLHSSLKDAACRHGDLKPENILCFENHKSRSPQKQPALVIADVGLAKVHKVVTEMRNEATKALAGTVMYEPPEAVLGMQKPRSRRYDIWSLGCIYLEFLIWMLYGKGWLVRFGEELSSLSTDDKPRFFERMGSGEACVKPSVQNWINHIRSDPRCADNTAIRHLVELISSKLLVVNLGRQSSFPLENYNSTTSAPNGNSDISVVVEQPTDDNSLQQSTGLNSRAWAQDVLEELTNIIEKASSSRPQLLWMNFQANSSGGPRNRGVHGTTLTVSQGTKGHRGKHHG